MIDNIKYRMSGKIQDKIYTKLNSFFNPIYLDVINESFMHNVPKDSETHFKVIVVSSKFEGISLINQHRMINDILKMEIENGVHALSIQSKTPNQWNNSSKIITKSPNCLGGMKKENKESV